MGARDNARIFVGQSSPARGCRRAADWATQPELSRILRGKFTEVSPERPVRFLTALGYHIEIGAAFAAADDASFDDSMEEANAIRIELARRGRWP